MKLYLRILTILVLPVISVLTLKGEDDANRYNVLFIAIDDLRPELGAFGASYVNTPNFDKFATEGIAFNRHYVPVPTCGASRYALLTGRSPARSGVTSNNTALYSGDASLDRKKLAGAQSLPELFRRSGYHTVNFGKISHTPDGKVYAYDGSGDGRSEVPHGWDEFPTPYGDWEYGWGAFFAYADGKHREDGEGNRDVMEFVAEEDDDLPDGMMTTAAIAKLGELKDRNEPFFLGLGFYKPHLPFVAPRKDWEAVADWDIPDAEHPERIDSAYWMNSGEFRQYEMPFEASRPLAPEARMKTRRAYLACVRYIDRQLGRVMTALDRFDLAENTIVVIWSDHGFYLGEFEMWGKHTTLERASRSPLMIWYPGIVNPGRMSDTLVETIDLFPTLMELARPSFDRTEHPLDGRSLVPILKNETDRVREGALTYWRNTVSVRTPKKRMIATDAEMGWENVELYDLSENLDSADDIADEHPELVESIQQLLLPEPDE